MLAETDTPLACRLGARASPLACTLEGAMRSPMSRRRFIAATIHGAAVLATLDAGAQPASRVYRIGAILLRADRVIE